MRRPSRAETVRAIERAVSPVGTALRARRVGPVGSIARQEALDVPATIALTSPAFADGQEVPARFCGVGIGENLSPPLAWEGVPEGTRRLLFVLEDLDYPSARHTGIHAAVVIEPHGTSGHLDEGALRVGAPGQAWVRTYVGRRGYTGPRPLPGHGEHRYVFHVFAIDAPITPPPDADIAGLVRMLRGRVTARGQLTGTRTAR